MASAPRFADLLDRPSKSVERPKPLPVGSYLCIIKGQPKQDESSQKKTPYYEFSFGVVQALDDVDQDDLNAWATKADGSTRSLKDHIIREKYYLTEDSLWRLTKMLDDAEAGDEEMSIRQRIDESPNCQIVLTIAHEATQDQSSVFARVKGTASASDAE